MEGCREALIVGVIGDVLNPFTTSIPLRVTYGSKVAVNGCEFKPSQVTAQPSVQIVGDNLRTFYTLVMVDPDAPIPSNPSLREYLHWLVTDIPAKTGPSFDAITVASLFSYPLIIEGDNLALINAIERIRKVPWTISTIVSRIKNLLHNFSDVKILQCYCECNQVVDILVSTAAQDIDLNRVCNLANSGVISNDEIRTLRQRLLYTQSSFRCSVFIFLRIICDDDARLPVM